MRVWAVIVKPTSSQIGQFVDTIWASINAADGRVALLNKSMEACAFAARVWKIEMAVEDAAIVETPAKDEAAIQSRVLPEPTS